MHTQTILILGASGALGSEFHSVLCKTIHTILAPSSTELNLYDRDELRRYLADTQPDIIINCAGWTNVVAAEDPANRHEVFTLNRHVPRDLAQYADLNHKHLIHFSTDYVFDGETSRFYTEYDLPNPINVYGTSKHEGEAEILALSRSNTSMIIRTSGLFSAHEKKVGEHSKVSFIDRIKASNEMFIIDYGGMTPTAIPKLVDIIFHNMMWTPRAYNGVYHMTSQGGCTWYQFGKFIAESLHLSTAIHRSRYNSDTVQRPKHTILENSRLRTLGLDRFAHWTVEFEDAFGLRRSAYF